MKILVTGGAGFIGSHVCDAFLALGHEVHALDDLSSGKRENLDPRVKLHVADIRSKEAHALILEQKFEAMAHLAAQMDVRKSVADPRFDADVNIGGFLNLLEAGARSGMKRVVFSSTGGAIYGEQDIFPAPETHPTRPVSPYGTSKAAGEIYLGYYAAQQGITYAALRYANVYGPRQNPHGEAGVVAIFSERLLDGKPCTIFGDGKQTRDFVFVKDVARANAIALTAPFTGPVNIGTGRETDLNELYAVMAKAAGVSTPPQYAAKKPGEQMRSCIDNTKARSVLGWKPEVDLAEGLRQTVAFFAERKHGKVRQTA